MKDAFIKEIENKVFERALLALRFLPEDVENRILEACDKEDSPYASIVLEAIRKNIGLSKESPIPLCQDTGMFWVLISIGRSFGPVDLFLLEHAVESALRTAADKACYRKSVVIEPVFDRENTSTNLPAVINYELVDGADLSIKVLLKGFGSENCTSLAMLRPTDGKDGVVSAVCDIVSKAGGKPCPPMFLGIGIGGTADRAALLSKKAFFSSSEGKDHCYAELEKEILERTNRLGIGAGGLGGKFSVLDVKILSEATHIAGMPLCVSISCWADRQFEVVIEGRSR